MKARFVTLIYYGDSYKNTGSVQHTTYMSSCDHAIRYAKLLMEHHKVLNPPKGRYIQVWDIKNNNIVWEP
jgi:hypothetical protein